MINLALAVLLAPLLIAQLQVPPRTPRNDNVSRDKNNGQAAHKKNQTEDRTALSAQATEKGPGTAKAASQEHPGADQPNILKEDPIIKYTRWVVYCMVLQSVILAVQCFIFWFTLKATRKGADAAHTTATKIDFGNS